jgi:uncharacterized protein with HEPN domain
MAGESINFNASLNTVGFSSGAKAMQDIASKASAGVANHFAKMAGAVLAVGAAFFGVRAAAQSFSAAISIGGQLNDLSARTGESAGNLLILRRAFENAGAGADSVGPTINRLQRAIVNAGEGSKEQAQAFAKLGLNLDNLKTQTPTEQLQSVAQALSRISTDSDRTALAMDLLGRSGGELIPLFRAMGSELDVARAQLGSTPEVMDKVSQAFDTIGDNLGAIGEKSTEFAAGLLEKLAPALAEITTSIASIDAAGFGRALSGYIQQTIEWLNSSLGLSKALESVQTAIKGIIVGEFAQGFNLLFLTAQTTASKAINHIVASALAALQSIALAIGYIFRPGSVTMGLIEEGATFIGATIAVNISTQLNQVLKAFVDSVPQALRPLANFMADSFLPTVSLVGKGLQAVLDDIDTSDFTNKLDEVTADFTKTARSAGNTFRGLLKPVAEELGEAFRNIPKSFAESYEQNLKNPLIDMRDMTAQTAVSTERLQKAIRAASFDAKDFGQAMRDSQIDRFAGTKKSSLMSVNKGTHTDEQGFERSGFRFPFQGDGPSGPPIIAPGGPTGGGSSEGGQSFSAPKSPLDRLEIISQGGDVDARTALMRLQAEQNRYAPRAAQLEESKMFRSAASAQIRNENRMQNRAMGELTKQTRDQFFGARNAGDAARNFEREAFKSGMTNKEAMDKMGIDRKLGESTRDALDRFAKQQAKTETERAREQADSGGGGGGGRAPSTEPATEATLKQIFEKIQERPILVA